jgi:hypothetical protein
MYHRGPKYILYRLYLTDLATDKIVQSGHMDY